MNEYKILEKLRLKLKDRDNLYGYNVGAICLDKKGRVISEGFNSYIKTHTKMFLNPHYKTQQIFVHAESDALYRLPAYSQPHTLIVGRMLKDGSFANSKPCVGCYYEISQFKLKKVYYTNDQQELVLLDLQKNIEEYKNGC